MLQRVMIAGALTWSPQLLVCDEPTTALDVTTQAEIISVLSEQRAARGMGMLFITHDLNLAASICDRVYVISGGDRGGGGVRARCFVHPRADYTQRLVAATPTLASADARPVSAERTTVARTHASRMRPATPLLEVRGLSKTYSPARRTPVRAVVDASFAVPAAKRSRWSANRGRASPRSPA